MAKVVAIPLLAVAALLFARTASARASIAAVLTVVAIAELMGWNTAFRLNAEPRGNYAVLEQPSGAEAEAIAIIDRELERDRARGERPRVEVAGLGGALAESADGARLVGDQRLQSAAHRRL